MAKRRQQDIDLTFNLTPSANSDDFVDLDSPNTTDDNGVEADDHSPLRNITVNNTGDTDVVLKRNAQQSGVLVPSGVIFTIEDEETHKFTIINQSGSTQADVTISLNNRETQKSILRDLKSEGS